MRVGAGVLALWGALLAVGSAGADLPSHAVHSSRPAFSARVVPLLEESRAVAAIEVEVPYWELSFRRSAEGLSAQFDVIVLIMQDDRQIAGELYPERIQVPGREALQDPQGRYRREMRIPLAPGQYTVEVAVSEPASGHEGRVRLGLSLEPVFPGQVRLSPLLFGPCGLEGSIADLFFDPRMVTQTHDRQESLCVYAELAHPGLSPAQVRVHWSLMRGDGGPGLIREEELDVPGGVAATRLSWSLVVQDLDLESYRVEIVASVEGKQARGYATVGVLAESAEALEHFFRETLDVLTYIAEQEEVEALRMAPPPERRDLWDAFWRRRDPTPESARNEFKEDFFDRLRYANAQFSGVRPGWRTDRGRIYIRYGEPDTVDRRPVQANAPPTEVWNYDRLGLRFVFIDRTGYGEYTLVGEG
jgi:GWxTD domain-containing protein